MEVSFVIPLFNCLPLTRAMLASLEATIPDGLSHEIILVDDGSTDGTREWLATLRAPYRVVLQEVNRGYASATNRGAAIATGNFLFLLNNDLILLPGWLEPMRVAYAELGARAGLIGNVQLSASTGQVDHAGMFLGVNGKMEHLRVRPSPLARWTRPVQPAVAVTGACMLVSKALWLELGGFDEGYRNGAEDVDLCFRARKAGRVNAVALNSVVRHHVSASPQRKARDEENTFRFTRRWRPELLQSIDRAWCWRYLETYWQRSRDPAEFVVGCQMLFFVFHLRRLPPPEGAAALNAALDAELARWQAMFG